MTKKQYKNATGLFSTQLAVITFVLGTVLLCIQLTIEFNISFILLGFTYVLMAFFFNGLMLIELIRLFITQKNHRNYYMIKILILTSNIPVTILYLNLFLNGKLFN